MTPRRPLLDRALAALPLALLYLLFCCLYFWQAAQRLTPTIFTDEVEFAQISRSIAETGDAARRGVPYTFQTLYTIVLAPVWWIDDTESAYAAAKYMGVLVMASAIFPAYALARMVAAKPWALFAAAGSIAVPALSYAPFLVEEPLAYPMATIALYLIVRFAASPGLQTLAVAAAVCTAAPLVRTQLAVLFVVLAGVLIAVAWETTPVRAWREGWTRSDWLGVVALLIGFAVVLNAGISHASESWYVTTTFYKDRLFELGLWAAGALAIGMGVLPFVGGLAALGTRWRGDARVRAFAITASSAIVAFGFYAAVKAAYLSTTFATRVIERNLIYLAPLLFAGTALLLDRARARPWAIAGAAAFTLYLILTTPFIQTYPYGDAPSLSIAALANREFGWDSAAVELALVLTLAVGTALLLARLLLRGRPLGLTLGGLLAALVLGWSMTAEIYAAAGSNISARDYHRNLPKPLNWLDQATGREPALYLGQNVTDATGVYLLEFWNRSLKHVWSVDGTAPGPGPVLTPDLARPDGTLSPDPGIGYVVVDNGVEIVGEKVGRPRGSLQLIRVEAPLRVRYANRGVFSDGWMGGRASYSQFSDPRGSEGRAKVTLSRTGWCGQNIPGNVVVRVGPAVVGDDKQPALGTPARTVKTVINACESPDPLLIPTRTPFLIDVRITPTFSPAKLDPNLGDVRELGAQVAFEFVPNR